MPSFSQRYQAGAGWGSSDEDHLLPEDRAPLTGASGIHNIEDLDDISPFSLGSAYRWQGEEDDEDDADWSAGPWTYAERFSELPLELPRGSVASADSAPGSPPPLPPDRPAGVRSRVWWRVMIAGHPGHLSRACSDGRKSSRGESAAPLGQPSRRKVPHAAISSGAGGRAGGVTGERIRLPLDRLRRAAVIGPSTLIVELDVDVNRPGLLQGAGHEVQPATLIIGPCDAPRFGSLLAERTATANARTALGQVVRKAKKAALGPPPLPPRPGMKDSGKVVGGAESVGEPKRDFTWTIRTQSHS